METIFRGIAFGAAISLGIMLAFAATALLLTMFFAARSRKRNRYATLQVITRHIYLLTEGEPEQEAYLEAEVFKKLLDQHKGKSKSARVRLPDGFRVKNKMYIRDTTNANNMPFGDFEIEFHPMIIRE